MEYLDYFKRIFTSDELKLIEECYKRDSITGIRTNLLKTNPSLLENLLNLNKRHPIVDEAFLVEDKNIKYIIYLK